MKTTIIILVMFFASPVWAEITKETEITTGSTTNTLCQITRYKRNGEKILTRQIYSNISTKKEEACTQTIFHNGTHLLTISQNGKGVGCFFTSIKDFEVVEEDLNEDGTPDLVYVEQRLGSDVQITEAFLCKNFRLEPVDDSVLLGTHGKPRDFDLVVKELRALANELSLDKPAK